MLGYAGAGCVRISLIIGENSIYIYKKNKI